MTMRHTGNNNIVLCKQVS